MVDTIREMINFMRASRIVGVTGGLIQESPNGTIIKLGGTEQANALAPVVQPLTLVVSRPSYIPAGDALASGYRSVWVTWGFCNDRLPDNWNNRLDVPLTGTTTKWIYLKANIAAAADWVVVTTCVWETWDSADEKTSPDWGSDGSRPAYVYILLGTVHVAAGAMTITNQGGGSIRISEYVSSVSQQGGTGFRYKKSFSLQRLTNG